MWRAGDLANRVVYVISKRVAILIAIEERWENFQGQRSSHKQWTVLKSCEERITELFGFCLIFRELQVVFRSRGLMTGSYSAVNPLVRFEQSTAVSHLLRSQDLWNL